MRGNDTIHALWLLSFSRSYVTVVLRSNSRPGSTLRAWLNAGTRHESGGPWSIVLSVSNGSSPLQYYSCSSFDSRFQIFF
jgi:hypothetical protein